MPEGAFKAILNFGLPEWTEHRVRLARYLLSEYELEWWRI